MTTATPASSAGETSGTAPANSTPYDWQNLAALFFQQAAKFGDKPFLWSKQHGTYQPRSWAEAKAETEALARGLASLGVKAGDRVMLVSENRPEWLVSDVAIMSIGGITTPAYTTNTEADHLHILEDSGACGVIVSTKRLAERVLPAAEKAAACRFGIAMDLPEATDGTSVDLHGYADVLKRAKDTAMDIPALAETWDSQDVACIIYTSGTGGKPKGVVLPHRAILHNLDAAVDVLTELGLGDDVFLSFLPLSHSYEHTAGQFVPMAIGAEIYYAEGIETLSTNMLEVRPTIMTAVPRLYETMRQRIERGLDKAGGAKQAMFRKTLDLGARRYADPGSLGMVERLQDKVLDKLVRAKVRDRFGGRLKALVSGGAPLNPDVGIYFTSLGLKLMQGYGQTESAPLISVNRPNDIKLHSVGPVVKNTDYKIAPDGEICVRGDLVMKGYWQNEDATNAAIQDGWLHTGDVGHIDEDGHLVITDRKKDIIVNSGGDNIAPQRVEGIIILEPEIAQAMVVGDKRPYLVALLAPDPDWLKDWAKEFGKSGDLGELAKDPDLHKALSNAMDRVNQKVNTIEKIRRFLIADDAFTVDNEQMTPTMKVRRHVLNAVYGARLEGLYR